MIVAYLVFMMREDIGKEWRHLRRAVEEPKWSSNYGGDWPENREGIVARIRSRIAYWNRVKNVQLQWANFGAAISRRSSLKKSPNPESPRGREQPTSTQVQGEVSTAPQLANPLPSHSPRPLSQRRTIFPDRLHRMRHIRSQNRETSLKGLIDGEISDASSLPGQIVY